MQKEEVLAAFGAVFGFVGVSAAAACCVLPLALATIGIGATGLAALASLHTPLSVIALFAVVTGWFFYVRKRRACAAGADCPQPANLTLPLLLAATAFVALSAIWSLIEKPLMGLFE